MEKVIHDLEQCLDDSVVAVVPADTVREAIALLKAQEPNTCRWVKERDRTNHWHCSGCGCVQGITARVYLYCPNCGAKKPAGVPQYKCDKCGWEPEKGATPPRFCPECGDIFDENDK